MRKNTSGSESRSLFRRGLESRAFYPMVGVLFALVSFGVGREGLRQLQLNQTIDELETEVQEIESRNRELTEVIDYLHTDAYKERQARESLGLQREGESVVVVPDRTTFTTTENGESAVLGAATDQRSNPEKWKAYFFGQ